MRKIIITFVLGVVCVLSGIGVFAFEVSQINIVTNKVSSEMVEYVNQISTNTENIEIDPYVYIYGQEYKLVVDSIECNPSLEPNIIKIIYPDVVEIHEYITGENNYWTISFEGQMFYDSQPIQDIQSFKRIVDIFKNKQLNRYALDESNLHICIEYGSQLEQKIYINDSFM